MQTFLGSGVGKNLMNALIKIARSRGIKKMYGEVLDSNFKMLSLVQQLGFAITAVDDYSFIKMVEKIIA